MQAERRNNEVTELVEVPSIDYAKAQPDLMSEANKVKSRDARLVRP